MSPEPTRYRSVDEDSGRWIGFPFRNGDIVISTRSKSGTTWMQMICALLVFQTPDLPKPLAELSPWLDWLVTPHNQVLATLEAQTHRRFIKTHTPLDGLPLDPRATFVMVARHPLDAAVSLYHQASNHESWSEERPPIAEWLRDWIEWEGRPVDQLDSLPGFMWHLSDAWSRRDSANVVLVHYDDLAKNLAAEMRWIASALGINISDAATTALATAASFEAMRSRSDLLAPDPGGVMRDRSAFFRRGSSGAAAELLSPEDMHRYEERSRKLAPQDLLRWLHR